MQNGMLHIRSSVSPVVHTDCSQSDARSLCAQFCVYPCSRMPQWLLDLDRTLERHEPLDPGTLATPRQWGAVQPRCVHVRTCRSHDSRRRVGHHSDLSVYTVYAIRRRDSNYCRRRLVVEA